MPLGKAPALGGAGIDIEILADRTADRSVGKFEIFVRVNPARGMIAGDRELTDLRATMTPDEFRELANAFDQKVQQVRQAQSAKGRALNTLLDEEREIFLNAAAPVLERLMREADAAVILERRSVFVSANAIEITDDAIALLNDTLGSGGD